MNRRYADVVVAVLVAALLVVGGALAWQAYRQQQALGDMGGMMDGSMGTMHGANPLWYVLGTLLLAGVVGGLYLVLRDDLGAPATPSTVAPSELRAPPEPAESTTPPEPTEPTTPETDATGPPGVADSTEEPGDAADPEPGPHPRPRVLELLPEDERRILEPVVASPGITQIALRDRADFSKSKVSQTVSDLEKRGLLYRERQGRTYRVYPGDDLRQQQDA